MLTPAQIQRFHDQGYLVVNDVIDRTTVLEPLIEEYDRALSTCCEAWAADGKLSDSVANGTFEEKVLATYAQGLDYFQPLDISLPGGDIAADTPFHAGPAAFALLTAPALLDAVEALIGPEITSNPIQHVRIKPPAAGLDPREIRAHITATDWHQDRAVTLEDADETRMVTAWVAVTDATVENGCLQVIPESHRGAMLPHCPNPQVGIPERLLAGATPAPLPVRSGGVVFFHPLTIHGSLANRSDHIRWSFDLRYNVTGEATGRPMFPEFVARSRRDPSTELLDPIRWHAMWGNARARLSAAAGTAIHRWAPDAAHCA